VRLMRCWLRRQWDWVQKKSAQFSVPLVAWHWKD